MEKIITLSGFGDFSEDKWREKELREATIRHSVEFYPTYYDHELKGSREAIEAITMELWSMPSDQWSENGLTASDEEVKCICAGCGNEHTTSNA
jgi:hypothetical protein